MFCLGFGSKREVCDCEFGMLTDVTLDLVETAPSFKLPFNSKDDALMRSLEGMLVEVTFGLG